MTHTDTRTIGYTRRASFMRHVVRNLSLLPISITHVCVGITAAPALRVSVQPLYPDALMRSSSLSGILVLFCQISQFFAVCTCATHGISHSTSPINQIDAASDESLLCLICIRKCLLCDSALHVVFFHRVNKACKSLVQA